MFTEIASFIGLEQLTGVKATSEMFSSELRKFSATSAIFMCSAVNIIIGTGGGIDDAAHDRLLPDFFSQQILHRIRALQSHKENGLRFVLHRTQLLYVIKEAARLCDECGLDARSDQSRGLFGRVLLMANDQLNFTFPEAADYSRRLLNTMASLVPVNEYVSRANTLLMDVARSVVMATKISGLLRGNADYLDVDQVFYEATGIEGDQYRALCFGLLSVYITKTLDSLNRDPSSFFLTPNSWDNNLAIDPAVTSKLMARVSTSQQTLKTELDDRDSGVFDFTPLRAHPILSTGSQYFAMDTMFLCEKLQDGYFWEVRNCLKSTRERTRLLRFWGYVFEQYLHWLLGPVCENSPNEYYPGPKFEGSDEELCDGLVICGDSAVLLEYKSATFTAEAKYSGDSELLEKELTSKLVHATGNKRKGVSQLAHSIKRAFGPGTGRAVEGVNLSTIRTVYPVIVTRDDIGGGFIISTWLNDHFQRLCNRRSLRPLRVAPLFAFSARDFEIISPYLQEIALSEILHDRYRNNRTLATPFSLMGRSLVEKYGNRRNQNLETAFANAIDICARELFPNAVMQHHHRQANALSAQASTEGAEHRECKRLLRIADRVLKRAYIYILPDRGWPRSDSTPLAGGRLHPPEN